MHRLPFASLVLIALSVAALLGASGCSSDASSSTGTTLTGNATAGATVFTNACVSCHGSDGKGTTTAPSLTGLSDDSDATLFDTVKNGKKNGMPAFSGSLSDPQIADVVAYLRTLK